MTKQCRKTIINGYHVHKCSRKAVEGEDGYCKQHGPTRRAKVSARQDAKYNKEKQQRDRMFKALTLVAQVANGTSDKQDCINFCKLYGIKI